MPANTLPEKNTNKEQSERKKYKLETGELIEILAKEFSPEKELSPENKQEKQNVIFIPGWVMSSKSSAVKTLTQSFADKSEAKAYAISSRTESEPGSENVLLKEAEAISKFIKEKGLKNIVIAGLSQGGDKAIDLVTILQNDPGINIHGLVLLDSVGLYDQAPESLTANFLKDTMVKTPITKNSFAAGGAVVQGMFREMYKSGITGGLGIKRMRNEVKVMEKINPRLAEVAVPVILMSGKKDPVSNPDRIIPPGEEEKIIEEWKKRDANESNSNYINPREEFLKKIFSKSPYIRAVFPEKFSHHSFSIAFRAKSAADASLYLIKRYERRKKTKNNSASTRKSEN